jgi:hypothetical protein
MPDISVGFLWCIVADGPFNASITIGCPWCAGFGGVVVVVVFRVVSKVDRPLADRFELMGWMMHLCWWLPYKLVLCWYNQAEGISFGLLAMYLTFGLLGRRQLVASALVLWRLEVMALIIR